MLEIDNGYYGGNSGPWNMPGIKKGVTTEDTTLGYERPATACEGARMHANHMAAYAGKEPMGTPHSRRYDACLVQQSRGY